MSVEQQAPPGGEATRKDLIVMVSLLLGAGIVSCVWSWWGGERISINDGTGFDGEVYASIVQDPGVILDHGLTLHRIQRIVPALLAYVLLATFGLTSEPAAIVAAFQVMNYAALALACLLWWQVARHLALSRAAAWIGYIALFVNYASLKMSAFYPVLTDRFGFLLGMLLVWLIVTRRSWPLLAVAVVGSFTWPTVAYSAMVAFVMDRRHGLERPRPVWGLVAAAVAAAAVAGAALRAHSCGVPCVSRVMELTTIEVLFPLSLLLVAAWTFLALQPLAARLTPGAALQAVVWWRVPVALAVMFVISRVQHALGTESPLTLGRTLWNTALGSVVKPLGFLVLDATYYGPGVLLLIFAWRLAVRRMASFGPRMVSLLIVYILLGVSTEPRVLVNQWPFFALAVALVAHELGWNRRKAWIFGAVALVMSRAWFPISHGPITHDWRSYPEQWYFMSNGPTTTTLSYVMLTVLTLAGAVVIWRLRTASPSARDREAVHASGAPYRG